MQRKNINRIIVQQALKHALLKNKKEILFLAGRANEIMQWGEPRLEKITVTSMNYKKYYQNYQYTCEKFTSPGIKLGEVFPGKYGKFYLVEKSLAHLKYYDARDQSAGLLAQLSMCEYTGNDLRVKEKITRAQALLRKYANLDVAGYDTRDLRSILRALEKLVTQLTGVEFAPADAPAKCARLAQIYSARLPRPGFNGYSSHVLFYEATTDFMAQEGYDLPILKEFPWLGKVSPGGADEPRTIYYDTLKRRNFQIFYKTEVRPPQLGKVIWSAGMIRIIFISVTRRLRRIPAGANVQLV